MNIITLLFLTAVAIAFLGPVLVILETVSKIQATRAKDSDRARIAAHRQDEADRRAQLQETRLARENNLIVLQDLKLEAEALKILKLKKELGLNAPDFQPKDY